MLWNILCFNILVVIINIVGIDGGGFVVIIIFLKYIYYNKKVFSKIIIKYIFL